MYPVTSGISITTDLCTHFASTVYIAIDNNLIITICKRLVLVRLKIDLQGQNEYSWGETLLCMIGGLCLKGYANYAGAE